jgi:organic hydroperoxide reductase OsmC/OhrA
MNGEYQYEVKASWTRDRVGVATAEDFPGSIEFAAPPEFHGEDGKWTPEHFFIAAVVSCFVVTFRAVAEMSKLEFLDLQVNTTGTLRRDEHGWRFAQITLLPEVTILHEKDRGLALKGLKKAEHGCLVARAMSVPVVMETSIKVAAEELSSVT